jgi:hypothetical protein
VLVDSAAVHRYQVYGLTLESSFPLPELVRVDGQAEPARPGAAEAPGAAEIVVRQGHIEAPGVEARGSAREQNSGAPGELGSRAPAVDADASWVQRTAQGSLSQFEDVGRFLVTAGSEIVAEPVAGCHPALLRHVLLGPVLAQVLWQRGLFALHASVLRIGRVQAAFVGVSGAGKSTTAVALHAAGHALICDDVAALDWQRSPVHVRPAFPRIRAHADSLTQLGERPELLERVHPGLDKWLLPARRFAGVPSRALDRIYVLEAGAELRIDLLERGPALLQLLRHTYYGEQFAKLYGAREHMGMAGRVASEVPVYRLTRPRDFARVPELVRLLEDHTAR